MKTLYIECNMGAAGDMLMAALIDMHPQPDEAVRRLNAMGIQGVHFSRSDVIKMGIQGTGMIVDIGGKVEESLDVSLGHAANEQFASGHIHNVDH
ncbi:MAG TPA: LarC family nickel insertion protein, partial [Clostridiaceae bacterium]|nr:LarC family nickel insertion protein [Clostridiaceae bacterium]